MDFIKIAKEVLEIEANELLLALDRLDEEINRAVDLIFNTTGKLIITGVGKSGLVGNKIAATFASTGTSSFFIHPTEAMHGDLGMIGKKDTLLAISYSGESEEIINIIPHVKKIEIPLIVFSGNRESTLAKYADVFINISVTKEACPLNIAPTASTTLTMALGDALAICLMKKRGFKSEDFARLHPGGSLGKRLYVKIKDIMRKDDLPIVSHRTKLKDAIVVMTSKRLGNVIIVNDNEEIIATLSDGDLRRALMSNSFDIEKEAIIYANKNPKICSNQEMLASEILRIIEDNKIQFMPIVKDKKVIGVIHIHDLIEAGIK